MGRSLLNVPLDVLHEQLVDLHTLLGLEPWAGGLREVGLDPEALAESAARAARAGGQAILALRLARAEHAAARARQRHWCEDFAAWAEGLRMQLRILGHTAPREAYELRRRIGHRPGRRFASSRAALDLTLNGLRAHSERLRVHTGFAEAAHYGQHLLEQAAEASDALAEAERARRERSRDVARVRRELQQVVRRIRHAWDLARHRRADLPELPLDALTAYAPSPRGAAPPQAAESALEPVQRELEAVQGELGHVQSESDAGRCEPARVQGVPESGQGESERVQGESRAAG